MRRSKSQDEQEIQIPVGKVTLAGSLSQPPGDSRLVIFAHGSGSSRFSPRNRYVAHVLGEAGLGTLLFDLLTPDEEAYDELAMGKLRFDIDLLAKRLVGVTDWLIGNVGGRHLAVGYFGASTGAAAALMAAAERPGAVGAVVSRGGRPDLAGAELPRVKAPTLLIVGGRDSPVITLNQEALRQLRGEKKLVIVPDATHLFEEPGTLEQVARLASEWFLKYLKTDNRPTPETIVQRTAEGDAKWRRLLATEPGPQPGLAEA